MTTSGIYEIRLRGTRHCYIGSSINMQNRKRQHFWALRKGEHHSRFLQRAFNKYGEDSFEWFILEDVPDVTMLVSREQHWIETKHPSYNMNPVATSNLGIKVSEAAKAKLREYNLRPEVIAKKKAELTGHPVLPETVELIKAARAMQVTTDGMLQGLAVGWTLSGEKKAGRKGQHNSDEHNQKIAEKATGRKATPETIEKMRAAKLGKKQDPELVARRIAASVEARRLNRAQK